MAVRHGGKLLVERQRLERGDLHRRVRRALLERAGPSGQRLAILAGGALGSGRDLQRADAGGQADVVGIDAAHQLVAPRLEGVDPGRHGVEVAPERRRRELGMPLVVVAQLHRQLVPRRVAVFPPLQHHAQHVVAVGEAVGGDAHALAGHALDGEAPAVDRRAARHR